MHILCYGICLIARTVGKTTVLTPTLVALLADGARLVCSVVPTALVVFTRTALTTKLGSAALGSRPVRTFHFGRRTSVGQPLLQRLRVCAKRGGVVLADPTSVKALFLKSIEVLHRLDEASRYEHDLVAETKAAEKRRTTQKSSITSVLFGPSKKKLERERRAAVALGVSDGNEEFPNSAVSAEKEAGTLAVHTYGDIQSLRAQAHVAAQVLAMLRNGVALLDEVDVVLHPLKSELNWPLGSRAALDFTIQTSPPGLRWRIPYLLLDVILCAAESGLIGSGRMQPSVPSSTSVPLMVKRGSLRQQRREQQYHAHATVSQHKALGMPRPLDDDDDGDDNEDVMADDADIEDDDEEGTSTQHSGEVTSEPILRNRANDDEGISSRRALRVAKMKIDDLVMAGLADGVLQGRPHVTLVSEKWYHAKLRPALTRWVILLLRSPSRSAARLAGANVAGDLGGVDDETFAKYLLGDVEAHDSKAGQFVDRCDDDQAKLINLYHSWLAHLLPFALSRINRVNYGLLSTMDIARSVSRFRESQQRQAALQQKSDMTAAARETGKSRRPTRIAAVPKARRLLAVPFVGKDRPSEASEFSHPDVLIGLSTLAYRHEGLRKDDVYKLVQKLRFTLENDENDGSAYASRSSYRIFERYVNDGGAVIRGKAPSVAMVNTPVSGNVGALRSVPTKSTTSTLIYEEPEEVWPLQLLDLSDGQQMTAVYRALQRSKLACRDYLWQYAFPETLSLRPAKLAASGQELGGDAIFGSRLGFSGTPNDLVPADLGAFLQHRYML